MPLRGDNLLAGQRGARGGLQEVAAKLVHRGPQVLDPRSVELRERGALGQLQPRARPPQRVRSPRGRARIGEPRLLARLVDVDPRARREVERHERSPTERRRPHGPAHAGEQAAQRGLAAWGSRPCHTTSIRSSRRTGSPWTLTRYASRSLPWRPESTAVASVSPTRTLSSPQRRIGSRRPAPAPRRHPSERRAPPSFPRRRQCSTDDLREAVRGASPHVLPDSLGRAARRGGAPLRPRRLGAPDRALRPAHPHGVPSAPAARAGRRRRAPDDLAEGARARRPAQRSASHQGLAW